MYRRLKFTENTLRVIVVEETLRFKQDILGLMFVEETLRFKQDTLSSHGAIGDG